MAKAKPPTSIWNRPIELKLGGLFTSLGKTIVDAATLNRSEATKDLVDVVAAFGLKRGPQEQAGLLISRALIRAVEALIYPYRADFPALVYGDLVDFGEAMNPALARLRVELDEQFLEHPRDLAIVGEFQALVEQWLGHVNLEGRAAKTIAARLPEQFVHALHEECVEHRADYSGVLGLIRSEFSEAWGRERSWLRYQHWFESELAGPVFAEGFGLAQIFIWPRAYYVENVERPAGRREHPVHQKERRHVVSLRDTLDAWLGERSRVHAIRVISGDPGAGKSSFARMFAAHRMARGERVLLIPLHTLDVSGDLIETIATLCRNTPPYPDIPFDSSEAPLLLILDGLDELAKLGRAGTRLALDFASHVQKAVNARNMASLRLQVLICGRPIAVQDVESDFRGTGQVLHLLPYVVSAKASSGHQWIDSEGMLAEDQREEWWRKYGELTGRPHRGLPEALAGESLVETTCQPLLGYLLALVHRDAVAEGKVLDRDVSRNEIYASLIASVHKRDYNKPGPGHTALRGLSLDDFEALLEEMALAAWREDARVVSVAAVEQLCEKSGLAGRLREYAEASQGGVGQLFTAFYFRRQRTAGEESFEFTHKSFAEYLVARRFITQLANTAEDLALRDASTGRRTQSKDEHALALEWLEVFGPNAITEDLLRYVDIEVRLRANSEDVGLWQATLVRLVNWVLREGMPCEDLKPSLRFIEMLEWAKNSEFALLAMLQACSSVTEAMSEIDWPSATACGTWLRRLVPQSGSQRLRLSRMVFAGQDLSKADLSHAHLSHAHLSRAHLPSADFSHANLSFADLSNSHLPSADFSYTNLSFANLSNAHLPFADFSRANLSFANLSFAHLPSADLTRADLRRSNITLEQLATTQGTPAYLPNNPDDD